MCGNFQFNFNPPFCDAIAKYEKNESKKKPCALYGINLKCSEAQHPLTTTVFRQRRPRVELINWGRDAAGWLQCQYRNTTQTHVDSGVRERLIVFSAQKYYVRKLKTNIMRKWWTWKKKLHSNWAAPFNALCPLCHGAAVVRCSM